MRFALFSALMFVGVSATSNVNIFQPNFKDPYSGLHDALLDIDLQVPSQECINTLVVQVHLPSTANGENNAIFNGPAFAARSITGISQHGAGNTNPSQASIAWDGSSILTFSNFIPSATGTSSKGLGWLNFNFDIPDGIFVAPGTPEAADVTKVPLEIVALPNFADFDTDLFINLALKSHFTATTSDPRRCGNNPTCPPGGCGDPVFSGFQGQQYQFHGLPDEHFNLVSSPDVQLNSHFVYLSSGKCDYNDTQCWTHAGTYMDVLGLSIADSRVKLVAGTHEAGMRVWINDEEIHRGYQNKSLTANTQSSLRYHHNGRVEIHTNMLSFEVVNSDMFFNIRAALNDRQLLKVGATHHTVTDKAICHTNDETTQHQLIEQTVAKKYSVNTPLHGLIGQTWRNVKVCGRDWMGTVNDYLVSDLFAVDNHYSYFKW